MHGGYTRTSKNLLTERFQCAFSFSTSIRSVETRTFHCCKRSAHARNRISNLTVCGRRVFSVGRSSDSRDNFARMRLTDNVKSLDFLTFQILQTAFRFLHLISCRCLSFSPSLDSRTISSFLNDTKLISSSLELFY